MTRILQIRRGDTAQNNNFTGLSGELLFDTTTKTLRVHDGETQGGFTLALDDQTGSESGTETNFDINSVPDEFWANIVATYAPTPIKTTHSELTPVTNSAFIEFIFDINAEAKFAQAVLVCQTPEAGYSIGDTISAFGIGNRMCPFPNSFLDANGLHVRLMVGSENFWIYHKTTYAKTFITNNNWKIQYIVWY
ncbi:MAG: hypothetical protein LBF37_01625 [Rickettsiales bacterium]|jgi:hypothetical protein|nr:hypothetical protein [Rickettsiales bacterium]